MTRWQMTVSHEGLGKYQVIRGDDKYVVEQKARAKLQQWEDMWQRRLAAEAKRQEKQDRAIAIAQQKALAEEHTQEAQNALAELEQILAYTLSVNDKVDWEALKDRSQYTAPQPEAPTFPRIPPEPNQADPYYAPKVGALDRLVGSRKAAKEQEAAERFQRDHQAWEERKSKLLADYQTSIVAYQAALDAWENERQSFLKAQAERNAAIDAQRADYERGEAGAVVDYCDLVLSNSKYLDYFPQTYEIDYNPENRIMVVDYQLPALRDIPTVREVSYVQSRGEFVEKHISEAQRNQIFNNVQYQIALRTIHELFEAMRRRPWRPSFSTAMFDPSILQPVKKSTPASCRCRPGKRSLSGSIWPKLIPRCASGICEV